MKFYSQIQAGERLINFFTGKKSALFAESAGKESPADHGDHADLYVVGHGFEKQ